MPKRLVGSEPTSQIHAAQLETPIPQELAEDLLKRLPYVSEALASVGLAEQVLDSVLFTLKPGCEDHLETVRDRIRSVADALVRNYSHIPKRVLRSHPLSEKAFPGDPHLDLEREGELRRCGAGRFALGPRLTALLGFFDRGLASIGRDLGAQEVRFPTLIGADVLHRFQYFSRFPHTVTLVSHLREDLMGLRSFAASASWNGHALTVPAETLAPPECVLSPTPCFHWYALLEGARLEKPSVVTTQGKCFRYESSNMRGLERLWDFSTRELIFVGSKSYVLEQRERAMDQATRLLASWGLGHRIVTASDPFFADQFAEQSAFQLAFDLKFEIAAPLPYRDNRELAVGSFNYHQDFFGKAFDISFQGQNSPAHTACVGFGLERVVLAFLAQHGVEPRGWPRSVSEAVAGDSTSSPTSTC